MIIKQTYVRIFFENMETINKREEELDVLSSTQKLYIALKRVVDFFVSLFMFIPFLVLFLIVKLAYLFKNDNVRQRLLRMAQQQRLRCEFVRRRKTGETHFGQGLCDTPRLRLQEVRGLGRQRQSGVLDLRGRQSSGTQLCG